MIETLAVNEAKTFDSIIVFTDGACTGNPGPGGWAAVIAFPEGHVRELGGGNPATTNNRMEMVGALKALQALDGFTEPTVIQGKVYSPSDGQLNVFGL